MTPQLQLIFQQAIQAFQSGNLGEADLIFQKILQNDINASETAFNLAIAFAEINRFSDALFILSSLKNHKNCDARIPYSIGIIHFLDGKYKLALEAYDLALQLNPNYAEALINKSAILNEIRDFFQSLKVVDQAIKLNENYYEAYSNRGNALYGLQRYKDAIENYDKALSLKPDCIEVWTNKGNTLHELKRYNEAIAHYDKALSLKSDYAEAWSNKGLTLHELKRYDEAIAHYDKALGLRPNYPEAWSNKGNTLHELKRYDEAIAHYDKALSLKSDYAEAWYNKGNVLNEIKRFDEAISHYHKALSLKANIDWVYGDLLHTKMKICSWSGLAESLDNISKKVMANEKVINPFPLLALNDNVLLHKKSSEIYCQSRYPLNHVLGPVLRRPKSEKIRIGYFSADFKNHPVSFLMAELFELHDKNKFEIFAFSFGANDHSPMRSRLQSAFNQFIEVNEMSDLDIAKLARDMNVDIAVDLGGYTADSRTRIFAYQAAPIQASYIGYLGTMGSEYIDYLFADKIIIPEHIQKFYSEKIIYLPSYQVNDRRRQISKRQFTRQALGLPETGFVFCCFNNNYKILPSTFDSWMRILNAAEGSVLFLYAENEWSRVNLINEAKFRGIDVGRLVFGEHIPYEEYLARYQVCDLFLDTFPYNAGTTASDALWSGLPVLTLMGQSFASRVAASLLNAIGLPELITNTQEEYETLAIELARNPEKLTDIKVKLANNRLTTPLFDTPRFTKNLEAAYIKMYERYQADLEPDHIFIT